MKIIDELLGICEVLDIRPNSPFITVLPYGHDYPSDIPEAECKKYFENDQRVIINLGISMQYAKYIGRDLENHVVRLLGDGNYTQVSENEIHEI